jgi:hypothetical protein
VSDSSRREFIQRGAAGGLTLLTFSIAGCERKVIPAQARAGKIPFSTLTAAEVGTLDALGEVLVPGAAAAGLSHFIDHQLSGPPADSMLMIKYLGVPAPFVEFYRSGLQSTNALAGKLFGKDMAALSAEQSQTLVGRITSGKPEVWSGPPAGLFYFVVRNDAIDAMYGTPAGFEKLGVPYMPHIVPPTPWGG